MDDLVMNDLIIEMYEQMKQDRTLSPADKILFMQLRFVLGIIDKAIKGAEEKPLVENITRSPEKKPYYQNNNYLNMYDRYFDKMMRLFRSFHLTYEQKAKLKTEKKESENRLQDLREKYSN